MPSSNRKRNVMIVSVITIIIFVSAFLIYEFFVPTYIDFRIDDSVHRFYLTENNTMTILSRNLGGRDGNFYIVLRFTNASFSNKTEQPYLQVDNATVKFPFFLPGGGASMSLNKTVYFTINENVTVFSFYLSLEKRDPNPYVLSFVSFVSYKWNETGKYYEMWQGVGGIP